MRTLIPLEVVPDDETPGAFELWVTATVAGRDYRLLLDTGGARSTLMLDDLTATFAPAPLDPADSGRGVLGPAPDTALRAVAPVIRFGPIEVRDLVIDVAPAGSAAPPVLGLDVLGGHRLDIRIAEGVLGIDADGDPDVARPCRLSRRSHPYLEIGWGDVSASAIFDTGAGVTVLDRDFADAHPSLWEPLPSSYGIDSTGAGSTTPMARLAACDIGGRRFASSLAAILPIRGIQDPEDPDFDVILGLPVIRQADWVIDLRRRVWGFSDETIEPR